MKVGIIMGSLSDWEVMSAACSTLEEFGIPYEKKVISAHRAPALLVEWASTARERGIGAIIAGAGGAAHLAGVTAGLTPVPVIGVPIRTPMMGGLDSLLSVVQMPSGVPVSTVAINGAKNAALVAVSIFALTDPQVAEKYDAFRSRQTEKIVHTRFPEE